MVLSLEIIFAKIVKHNYIAQHEKQIYAYEEVRKKVSKMYLVWSDIW